MYNILFSALDILSIVGNAFSMQYDNKASKEK